MVQIAIILGPNRKKSEHNWAFIERGETCEVDLQFLEVILHANSMQQLQNKQISFCNQNLQQLMKLPSISPIASFKQNPINTSSQHSLTTKHFD